MRPSPNALALSLLAARSAGQPLNRAPHRSCLHLVNTFDEFRQLFCESKSDAVARPLGEQILDVVLRQIRRIAGGWRLQPAARRSASALLNAREKQRPRLAVTRCETLHSCGPCACSASRGPAQPSPTLGDALNAGYCYLEVRCLAATPIRPSPWLYGTFGRATY